MNSLNHAVAFSGKLPSFADFIEGHMPRSLSIKWETWLQGAYDNSQQLLGSDWLDCYLSSPAWRFMLSPGLVDDAGYAGVLVPSVDKVGRYYPFGVFLRLSSADKCLVPLLNDRWFDSAEAAVLSLLEKDVENYRRLDQCLQKTTYALNELAISDGIYSPDCNAEVYSCESMEQMYAAMATRTLIQGQNESIWWTKGTSAMGAACMRVDGWPAAEVYAAMLDGCWHESEAYVRHVSLARDQGGDVGHSGAVSTGSDLRTDEWSASDMATTARDEPREAASHFQESADLETQDGVASDVGTQVRSSEISTSHEILSDLDLLGDPLALRPVNLPVHAAALTDVGNVRTRNEDALLNATDRYLWAVADGMGGHAHGDYASQSIVEALDKLVLPQDWRGAEAAIQRGVAEINRHLMVYGGPALVGSTLVLLHAVADKLLCLWAGDSRVYRLNNSGEFRQITGDHSVEISPNTGEAIHSTADRDTDQVECDASKPKTRSVLTRAVGVEEGFALDLKLLDLKAGERFVLCSDGLTNVVSNATIAEVLASERNVEEQTQELMSRALAGDAKDNVSLVVVHF